MPGVDHIGLQDRMLLQYEVEHFFYYESSLLDERRALDSSGARQLVAGATYASEGASRSF